MIKLDEILNKIKPFVAGWIGTPASYTPTWSAASVNPSLGNGTLTGQYTLRGKLCLVRIRLVIGSTTTLGTGNWSFSLPLTSANNGLEALGWARCRDTGANNYLRMAAIAANSAVLTTFSQLDNATNVNAVDAANPFSWGANDYLDLQIEYEVP